MLGLSTTLPTEERKEQTIVVVLPPSRSSDNNNNNNNDNNNTVNVSLIDPRRTTVEEEIASTSTGPSNNIVTVINRRIGTTGTSVHRRRSSSRRSVTITRRVPFFSTYYCYCRVLITLPVLLTFIIAITTTTTTTSGGPSRRIIITMASALSTSSGVTTPTTKKVAVIGGTGKLGRSTVESLLQRGISCKCLVRPTSTIPSTWINNPLIEIVRGNLVEECISSTSIDVGPTPPESIIQLLNGCSHCLALYGSTRKSKVMDWFTQQPPVEDTDMDHPKQVNYQSMKMLVKACQQQKQQQKQQGSSSTSTTSTTTTCCTHIIRITGKGEDPYGFFSVLINGLGSMAKGWNYEGEQVLRSSQDIDYTIIRPGIMKDVYPPQPKEKKGNEEGKEEEEEPVVEPEQYLALSDNGGNDLKVSPVGYSQIADLIVECTQQPQSKRVTLSAMNVPGKTTTQSLAERIQALKVDTREFPISLIDEHKKAVKNAALKTGAVLFGIILSIAIKVFFF